MPDDDLEDDPKQRAAIYRLRAVEALRWAENAAFPPMRAEFMRVASNWHLLAREAEAQVANLTAPAIRFRHAP